jgi:hypothetical protein
MPKPVVAPCAAGSCTTSAPSARSSSRMSPGGSMSAFVYTRSSQPGNTAGMSSALRSTPPVYRLLSPYREVDTTREGGPEWGQGAGRHKRRDSEGPYRRHDTQGGGAAAMGGRGSSGSSSSAAASSASAGMGARAGRTDEGGGGRGGSGAATPTPPAAAATARGAVAAAAAAAARGAERLGRASPLAPPPPPSSCANSASILATSFVAASSAAVSWPRSCVVGAAAAAAGARPPPPPPPNARSSASSASRSTVAASSAKVSSVTSCTSPVGGWYPSSPAPGRPASAAAAAAAATPRRALARKRAAGASVSLRSTRLLPMIKNAASAKKASAHTTNAKPQGRPEGAAVPSPPSSHSCRCLGDILRWMSRASDANERATRTCAAGDDFCGGNFISSSFFRQKSWLLQGVAPGGINSSLALSCASSGKTPTALRKKTTTSALRPFTRA